MFVLLFKTHPIHSILININGNVFINALLEENTQSLEINHTVDFNSKVCVAVMRQQQVRATFTVIFDGP